MGSVESLSAQLIGEQQSGNPSRQHCYNHEGNQTPEVLLQIETRAGKMLALKQTWHFLQESLDSNSGLPVDRTALTSKKERTRFEVTSPTNIGLALVSISEAVRLRLCGESDGSKMIEKIVDFVDSARREYGFLPNWHCTKTGEVITKWLENKHSLPLFLSSVDNGWLAVGLLITKKQFPKLNERIDRILARMDFNSFYNQDAHNFYGGYFVKKEKMTDWLYNSKYLSETRILYYVAFILEQLKQADLALATDRLPNRTYGGSIFEALMPALFVEEGANAESIFQLVIQRQKDVAENNGGFWGFSPCVNPNGKYKEFGVGNYRENGFNVITPHALILAMRFAPLDATKALSKIIGQYPEIWSDKGFFDSVDVKKGKIAKTWLFLDQTLIFLSLVNLLENDSLRRNFTKLLKT